MCVYQISSPLVFKPLPHSAKCDPRLPMFRCAVVKFQAEYAVSVHRRKSSNAVRYHRQLLRYVLLCPSLAFALTITDGNILYECGWQDQNQIQPQQPH
jgi:hypothetical protein